MRRCRRSRRWGNAKLSGRTGVRAATSGPGAIHLLNGLYDAKLDHAPVVAIVGQTDRSARDGSYTPPAAPERAGPGAAGGRHPAHDHRGDHPGGRPGPGVRAAGARVQAGPLEPRCAPLRPGAGRGGAGEGARCSTTRASTRSPGRCAPCRAPRNSSPRRAFPICPMPTSPGCSAWTGCGWSGRRTWSRPGVRPWRRPALRHRLPHRPGGAADPAARLLGPDQGSGAVGPLRVTAIGLRWSRRV